MTANTWKLQDAKARFSELVRKARLGEPQQVTVHGEEAVVVVDPKRFEVRPKQTGLRTTAEFLEISKQYRGLLPKLPPRTKMVFRDKKIFDESDR